MRSIPKETDLQKILFAFRSDHGRLSDGMQTPTCTKCRRVIPSEDINVANNVAYCRQCNLTYRLSDLVFDNDLNASLNLQNPPKGAWYKSDGGGTVIGASNRSLGSAFGLLFFTLFWNGIVSVFVCGAIAATLQNLHVPLPVWFPAPKMQNGVGPGMTIFLWLFLTPFIAIGLLVACTCLSCLFGRTEARIENSRGTLFTGVGPIGWKNKFDPGQVRDVRLNQNFNNEGRPTVTLLVEMRDGKQYKLGSLLTEERRQFVLGALRKTLLR